MVSGSWQFATILVLSLFVSLSVPAVILTDSPSPTCASSEQNCSSRKTNVPLDTKRNFNKGREFDSRSNQERFRSDRSFRENTERNENWDHHHDKFDKNSERMHDRIRDVKRSVLDQRRRENTDSRRFRNDRRYADERYYDDSEEVKNIETVERPETIRDRLTNKFTVADPEDGYDSTRMQRRFSLFRDEVNNAKKVMTRFERLRKYRMRHLYPDSEEDDGTRITSRFERTRQDRLNKLSKGDGSSLDRKSETDSLLPRHFQNFRKFRDSLDRTESAFDRYNAYITQIRNKIRLSSDDIREEPSEPTRFEVQRKHKDELIEKLKKEEAERIPNEESDAFMENRRLRKEERRLMEEKRLQEEKQRLLEEEKRVIVEKERIREREQTVRETERKVQDIIRLIREKERQAVEERQKKLDEEKRLRLPTLVHEDDKHMNVYDDWLYDRDQLFKDYEDWLNRQYDLHDYDENKNVFDEDDNDWDYSDYDSLESYEDDELLNHQRRLREDIRRSPDIRRQIRDNIQMYGREYLNSKDYHREDLDNSKRRENSRKTPKQEAVKEEPKLNDETEKVNDKENNRQKRSINERNRSVNTNRRFHRSSEIETNKENRQIVENRSFRSQDERLTRRINLRKVDGNRQSERGFSDDTNFRLQRQDTRQDIARNHFVLNNDEKLRQKISRHEQKIDSRTRDKISAPKTIERIENSVDRRMELRRENFDDKQKNIISRRFENRREMDNSFREQRLIDSRRAEHLSDDRVSVQRRDDFRQEDENRNIDENLKNSIRDSRSFYFPNQKLDDLKKSKQFQVVNTGNLLQAALIGFICTTLIMQKDSFIENKYGSRPKEMLQKFGSIFSNIKVF